MRDETLHRQLLLRDQLQAAWRACSVFTRPIEMAMFLIHSSFSANSTGLPCTPMLATLPPGRTISRRHGERLGHADGLDRDVDALTVGEGEDLLLSSPRHRS